MTYPPLLGTLGFMVWLNSVKATSWGFVALAFVAYAALLVFANQIFFEQNWQRPIDGVTHGLVEASLQVGVLFFLGIGALFRWVGKLGWHDLALMRSKLLSGIGWTLAVWVVAQLVQLLQSGADVAWASAWSTHQVGGFLGQIFGNALQEEIFFRAFLISQIFLLLRTGGKRRAVPALIAALIISQMLFAVMHAPNRLYNGRYDSFEAVWQDQAALFIAGLFFSGYFLLTNNLFFAVGVHALANRPMPLVEGANFQVLTEPLLAFLIFLALWRRWRRAPQTKPG